MSLFNLCWSLSGVPCTRKLNFDTLELQIEEKERGTIEGRVPSSMASRRGLRRGRREGSTVRRGRIGTPTFAAPPPSLSFCPSAMDTSDPVAAPPDDDEPRGRAFRKGRREKGKVAGQREAGGGARKEGGGARRQAAHGGTGECLDRSEFRTACDLSSRLTWVSAYRKKQLAHTGPRMKLDES